MIERLFDTTFRLLRQVYTGNISTQTEVGSFAGHIQQITPEERIALGNSATLTHRIWCSLGTDVRQSDKLVDPQGRVYAVTAVQRFPEGREAHLELIVAQQREQSV